MRIDQLAGVFARLGTTGGKVIAPGFNRPAVTKAQQAQGAILAESIGNSEPAINATSPGDHLPFVFGAYGMDEDDPEWVME